MKLLNLTGHDINFVSQNADGQWTVTKILPSQGCARVTFNTVKIDEIDGIEVFQSRFGETIGLPPEVRNFETCSFCGGNTAEYCSNCIDGTVFNGYDVYYVVSKIVAEANPQRDDLLIVSETVRDGATIIGCKGLAKL